MTKEILELYLNTTYKDRWPDGVQVLSFKEVNDVLHNPNGVRESVFLLWYNYCPKGNDVGSTSINKENIDDFIRNQRDSKIDEIIKYIPF